MERSQTEFRRFWLLALLQGVERAGRSPISLKQLHSLAYLANALSPCYGMEPLEATILKEDSGPLYPELVWDVDRLAGMGLVRVSDIVMDEAQHVRSISYGMTSHGMRVIEKGSSESESLNEVAQALWSISLAYMRNPNALEASQLLAFDGNYADRHFAVGDVIDFGEWDERNATVNAVNFMTKTAQGRGSVAPSVGVNLYAQYLMGK